jgi:2-hydroxychromene-2-carboxylate isomerase
MTSSDKTTDKVVDFYFDFGSPAAYLAWTQLPKLATETGATVVIRPMLLGGVFQATGNHSPATIPAKGKYTFVDFSRYAKSYGVPLQVNPHFPVNTLMLMRAATGMQLQDAANGTAMFKSFCDTVFKAMWVEARNLNDPGVVGAVLTEAGYDPAAILALSNDPAVKDALKATTTTAIERGVFGAPTFFVGDQMFWGQDRFHFIRESVQ